MKGKLNRWALWRSFPDPKRGGYLSAPFGPGVYELRNRASGELIYCGEASNVAKRMTSLLPTDAGGAGTRNNWRLRRSVLGHLADIEYRTKACANKNKAKSEESRQLKDNNYLFN